ncbi:hypothetical protein DH09_13440 [Bacillaceae bacterium JMAK1]|nr:hypothetical protein DH09_13440 [Bacillaceae bacterium JMAK1]
MNSSRGFGIMLAFFLIILIEPIRVMITGNQVMDSYWFILFGFLVILAIVFLRFTVQAVRRNRARSRHQELDTLSTTIELTGDFQYQEPIDMMHDHPVQVYDAAGNPVATYKYRFRNTLEKWFSLSGFMDFRNIEVTSHHNDDIVLFQAHPLHKNFWRPKWNVYLNGEERGLFEVAPLSMKQIQKEMVFDYRVDNKKYQLISPRLSTDSKIKSNKTTLMEINRTFFSMTSKGDDGERGRKHELTVVNDDELSFLEKIGLYQQSMTRTRN